MWIAVRQRFRSFHQDLKLTDAQRDDGATKATGVARSLKRAYYPDAAEQAPWSAFMVGSWGKQTQVRPPNDVDMMFEVPLADFDRINGRLGNVQSALLQEIKESLLVTYPQTDMRGDGQVVQVKFNTLMVEVVPVFRLPNGQYYMPETKDGGRWKLVDPVAEFRGIDAIDTECKGNVRAMCQMLKLWSREQNVPLKSFQIELLVCDFMRSYRYRAHDYFWYDWFLRDFFHFLVGKTNGRVFVPGTNEIVWLGEDWKLKAERAYKTACEACMWEQADYDFTAGQQWQKIFGNRIPARVL